MRHLLAITLILIGFGGFFLALGIRSADASSHHVQVITIDGPIDAVSERYLSRGLNDAAEAGAQFVIVKLNTPGGLLESTRDTVESILAAKIPVVVFVSPSGAQAASAGTFIAVAGHIAAMAPGTNIGAASPVTGSGEDIEETIRAKVTEDTAAFLRSIADERSRNSEALEDTVLNAKSYTATEAIRLNVVDLVANDVVDLVAKLHGRLVNIGDISIELDTQGIQITDLPPTTLERFLGVLANPDIAFVLFAIGGLGILIEMFSPGLVGPGVVGVIALSLSFVAFGQLPVNWIGAGLMVLAIGLFYLEMQASGIGIFGIGGAIAFVLGAFFLFGEIRPEPAPLPAPNIAVSLWIIATVSILLFGIIVLMIRSALQAHAAPVYDQAGYRNLVSELGVATSALNPSGIVRVGGELWSAESDSGDTIDIGEQVVVLDVQGLTLKVFKAKIEGGNL